MHTSRHLIVAGLAVPALVFSVNRSPAAVTHRWAFDEAAGPANDGAESPNLAAAGGDAVILGAGAEFTGTGIALPGGSSATAAYVDLPNNLISPHTAATIEMWVTVRAAGNAWARYFDFGNGQAGELEGPGGSAQGTSYLLLSAATNTNYSTQRLEFRVDPSTTTELNPNRPEVIGEELYIAVTLDNSLPGLTIVNYWRGNEQVLVDAEFPYDLAQLDDVNNWLGRSNWTADANLNGIYNEVRIHNTALTPDEVFLSRANGPESLPTDADNDGMPDGWEAANGLNPAVNDAAADPDGDGLSNAQEFQRDTNPQDEDSDDDGLKDGVETNTGTFVSAGDTGTDPLNPDTDGDGLSDGVETGTGTFVSAADTGTNPLNRDTDGDLRGDGSEVAAGSNPLLASSVPAARLANRYSFGETSGRMLADSAGGAPGYISGNGFSLADGALHLDGGPQIRAAYAALPPGILSANGIDKGGRGAVTVEGWATVESVDGGAWARILDFGSSQPGGDNGGIFAPGDWNAGGVAGLDYLLLAAYTGTDDLTRRAELRNEDPAGGGGVIANVHPDNVPAPTGTRFHFAVTYDETSGVLSYFEDGQLLSTAESDPANPIRLGDINDVNNWIGRSNFMPDGNLHGSIDELRIYDGVLTDAEIAAHSAAGPDAAPQPAPVPDTDGDGMADWFERAHGLNPADPADAAGDPDGDGLSNLDESRRGSSPHLADTDGDGLSDAVETNTGVFVSATDTGTSPIAYDSDGDTASDNAEVAGGSNPLDPASAPAQIVHRWRFNNAAGAAPDGSTSPDEVGGADAVIRGDDAAFTGAGVMLPGGPSDFAAYIDLPNHLVSAHTQATLEGWVRLDNADNAWARIFDIGNMDGFEVEGPGGAGNGGDVLMLSAAIGADYNNHRFSLRDIDPDPIFDTFYDFGFELLFDELTHFVVSVDSTFADHSRVTIWMNGQPFLMHAPAGARLPNIDDVNVWLGRSNWTADGNLGGTFEDFRIYRGILSAADVAKNFADGPNADGPAPAAEFAITSAVLQSPGVVRIEWETEAGASYQVQTAGSVDAGPWTDSGAPVAATGSTATADVTVPAQATRLFVRVRKL